VAHDKLESPAYQTYGDTPKRKKMKVSENKNSDKEEGKDAPRVGVSRVTGVVLPRQDEEDMSHVRQEASNISQVYWVSV
jgi:hypothetical protein